MNTKKEQNEIQWDSLKPAYDLRSATYEGGKYLSLDRKHRGVIEYVSLAIKKLEGNEVFFCDAGCGNGIYLNYLKNNLNGKKNTLEGFDFAEKIVRIAKENTGLREIKTDNLENMSYPDERFNIVLCTQVIEHMLDDKKGMSELNRVLKKNGYLVLSTDNKNNIITKILNMPFKIIALPFNLAQKIIGDSRYFPHKDYSLEEFRGLIASGDFEIIKMETFRFSLPFPLYRVGFLKMALDYAESLLIKKGFLKNNGDIVIALCRKK